MSIQSPVGTLDIKNATLRVGKLEVSNIQGVDTALNVTRANSVLIYDDQVSTTTFNGFTSSVGVRDTGNGYLDLAGGYVYWGQKLPNSWVMDFEMDIRSGTNAGPLYANVFSTTNTGGDGYSFTFNDSNDKISLYYDSTLLTETTVSGLFTASEDWQKVVINYERGLIAISLDGSRKFYYKDIERETPYVNGEYVSFSSASTDGRKIRDLRIVNGEKWVYSGESNLVYTQGSVGIGVTDPTVALDVSGTVKATAFDGDGSAITNISSANVGDFASNVVRIENLETSNGHIWSNLASNVTILRDEIDSNLATARTDLQSNVTILRGEIDSNLATARTDLQSNVTILRGEIDSNLATARTDLQSNVTILRGEIDSNLATARTDLQSNVTILRDTAITFMGTKTFQDDVVLESNLRVQGDLLVANTVNMTVSDPILELGSNNQNTGDVGLVMTRHGASNSNVAIFFDETADTLKLGYTLNGAGDSTLEFDSNALAVSVQGALTASTGTFSGDVGIGTTAPGYTLDVDGDINFTGTFYQGGSPFVSSLWTDGQDSLYYRSNVEVGTANLFVDTTTSRVGINTITPGYDLDVDGDINFTGNFYQGGSPFVSSEWTTGSESLYYRSNVEIGTANLFVDTTTSRVGIATDNPAYDLDVHGTSNVGALTVASVSGNGSGLTSLNATNISSGTINKDRLPGTLNNTTIGSLAIGANDVTLTAKANYHGLKILKAFDSPDEPATLLLSGDGDVFDDIAFEIRGNTSGSSVDTTTTRNSDDTTFGILHTGHTYIGYANLNPGEAGGNSQSGDPMLNVNGAGAFTGDFEVGTANLFVDVSTSNVGIGTTSPAYTLDVHGTSNVGALTATSVSGNVSGLTSLNASNISSGTINKDRLPGTLNDTTFGSITLTSSTCLYVDGDYLAYNPVEGGSSISRNFVKFIKTDNASYPFYTNRTPSGDVVIGSGTTAAGGEIERMRFKGGDGTRDIEVSNANLVVSGNITGGTIDAAKISNGTLADSTGGVKAIYFTNTEQSGYYTDKSGILAFDQNFYDDTEYGTGTYDPDATFVGGNGGGLLIKNEDGWGAIFTSQNTRWAKGYWDTLNVTNTVTASTFSGSGSGLTSLNASNLTSGTVSSDRLSLAASDIPDLSASKITTGTLTRPIDTTTGTFSGRVDSDRYLTSNTFPLPDPNQHSFRHVCMITNTSVPYGLTQPGGCIYEYNPLTGDTVRVVEPVSEPTVGTFEATAGREYFPMGSPMTIVREHRIAPFTNLGSLFGFIENRFDASTAYLYAPYTNVTVEYFHDTSVTGTPTSTIVVPSKTVVSFTCTSASGTNSHIFVVKGGRILMSSTGNGGDDRVLAPLSTIAYGYHNTSFKKDIYLQNDVTTSGKCVYSNQNVPLILSQAGDGDGSDATCGIQFELVADTYIVPHDIRGWMIQFLYTETVVNVAYWSATNSQWEQYGTYSPSGTPSILSPEQLQEGKMGTNDTDINTSHTLWMFTGTKDFTLTVEEYTDNERIVSGFRVHQVAQQIQTNLLDNVVQDSSGNVGIGVTSPDTKFEVFDQTKFNVDVSDATYLKVGNRYSSSDQLSLISAGDVAICSDWNANQTGKNIDFRTNTDTNGGTLLMRIQDDGNVGIGTTSPGYKLHVNGTSQFEAEMRWDLGTRTSHAGYSTNKDWYIRSGETAGNVILQDGGGNVGIGTGSPATLCDLSLASGTDYSNTVALTIRNYSSDYTQIANGFGSRIQFRTNRGTNGGSTSPSADIKGYVYSGAGGTGDYHALDLDVYGDNSSLNRGISIVSTSASGGPANTIMYGDVGIGTTSPDDNLHIYSSETGGTQLKIQNANTSGDNRAGLFLQTRNSNNFSLQFTPSSDTVIFDNNGQGGYSFYQKNGSGTINNVMQILPDGNVGIGATSPSAKLHVNGGNLKISAAAGGGVYDNGYQWLECDNDGTWGRLARTARTNGIACYNGIAINDNGGLVVGSWDSPNALGVGNGKFTGNLYVNGSYHESGVKVRTTREWYFDLTAQANTNFYPILLKHSGYMIPINFKLVGESLAGGNSYNEETLVGFVRGGGWTDHNPFYEVTSNRYESTEKRIQGIWEGSAATNDHVAIYVRGGYNYRIDTDADTAFVSTTAYSFGSTTNDAVFAIKNESGTYVSGTSRAISELVDTAASNHASRKFVKSAVYISDSLECQGRIYANNGCHAIGDWFRVNGSNGIYFESHGGGWHMTDGSWVRAYGGKGVYAAGAFYTDANRSVIRGESPTLYFRDTNAASAMIHNNDNILYILRGGTDTEGWSQVNGVWPWMFNLGNNDSTCGGSLYCYGNVTAYSDIRHKRDIVKLDNALEKVEKLNGYKYTRKNDGKRYTGLIAQEVLEVLPEAVIADEKGEYSLAYGNMAGLFVEAMKEMSDQLQAEKAKVATLETQLASVLARLDALENPPS